MAMTVVYGVPSAVSSAPFESFSAQDALAAKPDGLGQDWRPVTDRCQWADRRDSGIQRQISSEVTRPAPSCAPDDDLG
ncbi:hypothetical protein SAMN06297251_10491 [Fulvimarina manganoxydans]|uniref:Uncharacterized protein n=1 Tax=Fulvimarina manganoxydans TaxID=937218 RepID=A0A1W2ADV5_9HYPH|nr:hypothetical protein SAMN06297251_10491 [Fulvimarina manganoxydans]